MTWIYISPHFDDVALSCGGLPWEQSQAGEPVQVWTICAGEVPHGPLSAFAAKLHTRWNTSQNAPAERCAEDLAACRCMGARQRHFDLPDCIYRRGNDQTTHLYASEEGIFGPLHPEENELVGRLAEDLAKRIPKKAVVVCPLTLGGHVDHRLTHAAVEKIDRQVWYYADYPYVLSRSPDLETLRQSGWQSTLFTVSEAGLEAWIASVAAYRSQVSTFWPDEPAMREALHDYWQSAGGGVRLWRKDDHQPDR
jgi:LmbE family N-acetylglucosaminyl deacetylase